MPNTAGPPGKSQVLFNGERSEHSLPAGHLTDPEHGDLVRWSMGDVATVEYDRPAIGFDDAADRLQQRALAGAVGSEQRHDLTLFDVDVDTEQHLSSGIASVDGAHQQQVALPVATLIEGLAAGSGRSPDLGDVGVDGRAHTPEDEAADDEQRNQYQQPPANPDVTRDPTDEGQHDEARYHPQRRNGEPCGARPRRDGQ